MRLYFIIQWVNLARGFDFISLSTITLQCSDCGRPVTQVSVALLGFGFVLQWEEKGGEHG